MPPTRSATRCGLPDIERAGREIIEKEERFRPLADQIVDAHRHEVLPDVVQKPRIDRDAQFRADAIGRGDKDRVLKPGRAQIEKRAEAADPAHDARPGGRAGRGLDPFHQRIARGDVNARLGIAEPLRRHEHLHRACAPP